MTDTRRPSPEDVAPGDRSVVAARRGAPWWSVVLLALVLTGIGAAIDLGRGTQLTGVFAAFYAVGCVLAVLVVARRGLFATAVQPPLVLVVAVPVVAELTGSAGSGGLRSAAIALALPLVNSFPTMAVTTVVVLVLALVRVVLDRRARAGAPARPSGVDDAVRPAPARTGAPRPGPARGESPAGARPAPRRGAPPVGDERGDPRAARGRRAEAPQPSLDRSGPRRPSDPPRPDPRSRRPEGERPRTVDAPRPEPRRYGPTTAGPGNPGPSTGEPRPARSHARDDEAPRRSTTRLPPLRDEQPRPSRPSSPPADPQPSSSHDRYWRREQ